MTIDHQPQHLYQMGLMNTALNIYTNHENTDTILLITSLGKTWIRLLEYQYHDYQNSFKSSNHCPPVVIPYTISTDIIPIIEAIKSPH